ncbi:MAG: TetR/AcrR family transcriptional regulator, partial [Acidimicrobiia bacterium]
MSERRDELVAAATAWVLEHDLGGLSLRPLAKALGTSDRMLMYYFGSRDGLVAAISDFAGQQLVAAMPAIDPAHPPRSAKVWLD